MVLQCFRRGVLPALLLVPLISLFWLPVVPVYAQGGLAMAGAFSGWEFEIPQGSEVSGKDAFVVVFNNSDEDMRIDMTFRGPDGVEVSFSEAEFTLEPGAQKKVFITVSVSEDAVPGTYDLIATATASRVTPAGVIGVATALAQKASLKILGEAAWVNISVASPEGEPVVAEVRLFKVIEGRESEFGYSDTGTLEAKVSPGEYLTRAYVGGKKLAEESFDIAADETKTITFTVKTVYFAGVGVLPSYYTETGELAFAKVVYTLNNLYRPMADAEVILKVSLDGARLEEISLLTLGTLDVGTMGGSHNYIPSAGWKSGKYGFKLELYTGGELYTTTLEEELEVTAPAGEAVPEAKVPPGQKVNWPVLGGIIAAVVVIGITIYLVRRGRQVT